MKKQWVLVCVLAGTLTGSNAVAQHKAPNQQPSTTEAAAAGAPTGDVALGSVRLPRGVTADGKPLPAGTYNLKLTAAQAAPEAVGTTEALERWVELSQGKEVKGREVVSIVPQAEIKMVVKDTPPASGASIRSATRPRASRRHSSSRSASKRGLRNDSRPGPSPASEAAQGP